MTLANDIRMVARAFVARAAAKSGDLRTDGSSVWHKDHCIISRITEGRFRVSMGKDFSPARMTRINDLCKRARVPFECWTRSGEVVASWADDEGDRFTQKVLPRDEICVTRSAAAVPSRDRDGLFLRNVKRDLARYNIDNLRKVLSLAQNKGEVDIVVLVRNEIEEREKIEETMQRLRTVAGKGKNDGHC